MPRVGVHHPQPGELRLNFSIIVEQRRQTVALAQVVAVARRVLADEHDLAHALGEQLADLAHDPLGGLLRWALHQRDGAEGAALVAAVEDLEVGARPAGRRGRDLEVQRARPAQLHQAAAN